MDLKFSPDDENFRLDARAFIQANYPRELHKKVREGRLERDDYLMWHRILAKQGWVAPHWPKEWGGTGWSISQRYIWDQECARADTVPLLPFGLNMLAPVIYSFGSQAQKERFLPRIYNGQDWWCQGYSEPGSGSDLASLSTKAVRDGDHYVVNGTKTWTTFAQYADWMFCLVRTDPQAPAQKGISFLLIDMKSPGVSVHPIITMDGTHHVNQVHFEEVRVPVENRIGEENRGWTYAKFLLGIERTVIAGVARAKRELERLKEIARTELCEGAPLSDSPAFAAKLAQLEIDLTALEYTELRCILSDGGTSVPPYSASILKIGGSEIQQRISELTLEAVGYYGHLQTEGLGDNAGAIGPDYAGQAAAHYLDMRKASIYGGSNEIQHNIMAKLILGL